MEPTTLLEAVEYFKSPANCREYLVPRRWAGGVVTCPRCGSKAVTDQPKYNRWQCSVHHDRRQFTLKTGTIFEDSPLGLDKWLPAMWLICSNRNGISSWELHRALGVTQKTAWFMLGRIRLGMQDEDSGGKIGGEGAEVEVDETFIGGAARFMRKGDKARKMNGKRGGADAGNKTIVLNHLESYVEGNCHANGLENFRSLLKRSIKGTHVSVEPFHLFRYVDEQAFRFNNKLPMSDADRFSYLVRRVAGKRLTYAELIGHEIQQSEAF